MLDAFIQKLHQVADAHERLATKPKVTIEISAADGGDRRESILRNQKDAELEATARKLVPKLRRFGL